MTSPSAPIPASAPVRVHDRIRAAPDGAVRVLHRGAHAAYVEIGGACVGIVDAVATRVPCAVRTAGVGLPVVRDAHVTEGVLHLDDRPVRIGRFVDVSAPRVRTPATVPADLTPDELATLVGVGEGLTPYGDDLVCGWIAAHRAAGIATPEVDAAVRALADRTTLLSATLLDCALHGEVLPEFGAWLQVVGTPSERHRAAALAAVGHTSGLGLLRGARRALAGLGTPQGAAA